MKVDIANGDTAYVYLDGVRQPKAVAASDEEGWVEVLEIDVQALRRGEDPVRHRLFGVVHIERLKRDHR